MKITTTQIDALLAKPVVYLKYEEITEMCELLNFKLVKFEKYNNLMRLIVEHEGTKVECTWFDTLQPHIESQFWMGNIGQPQLQETVGNSVRLMYIIYKMRTLYCREYAVTIQQAAKGEYTAEEMQTIGHHLCARIFNG